MNSKNPSSSKRQEFTIGPNDDGKRIDKIVRVFLPQLGLSALQKAIREGDVRLNGKKVRPETPVSNGDSLGIWNKLLENRPESTMTPRTLSSVEDLKSWIVFESTDLLAINKPRGVLVHNAEEKTTSPPLDEIVRAYLMPRLTGDLTFRPGPLNRLDRPTSGLVVFSASILGARNFSSLLQSGRLSKHYLAILDGNLQREAIQKTDLERLSDARITRGLVGQEGRFTTHFFPLLAKNNFTLARILIEGGKTHQIRIHAQILGYPLSGDAKYGSRTRLETGWNLHAWILAADDAAGFPSPMVAPPPPVFLEAVGYCLDVSTEELERVLAVAKQSIKQS